MSWLSDKSSVASCVLDSSSGMEPVIALPLTDKMASFESRMEAGMVPFN